MATTKEDAFGRWLETKIKPLIESGEYSEKPAVLSAEDAKRFNGIVKEPFWTLSERDFYIDPTSTISDVPSFGFMRDATSLYLGARYEIKSAISLDTLKNEALGLRLNLAAVLGNFDLRLRIRFLPFDEEGASTGRAYVDCGHYRKVENYKYYSQIDEKNWSFVFSISLSEIMDKEDRYLFYKLTLIKKWDKQEGRSFYPIVQILHDKDGRSVVHGDFRNFLEIEG